MERVQGSHNRWNDIWVENKNINNDNTCLFTKGKTANILEFWQRGYANDILKIVKKRNLAKFCELGSGRATTSTYLAYNGYHDVTLVDLAEAGLNQALENFEKHKLPKPKTVLANVEKTNLADSTYDCIYNIGLLEHFEDPYLTLVEAYRLLKDDGIIFMPIVPSLPFEKSLFLRFFFNPLSIPRFYISKFLRKKVGLKNEMESSMIRTEHDKSFYERKAIADGFSNVKCIPYNPFHKVTSSVFIEKYLLLPFYNFIYKNRLINQEFSFQTIEKFESCYLLIGEKNIQ
jgi:ubiquinone/menaquinone biosynthesis C-methylase UbiE